MTIAINSMGFTIDNMDNFRSETEHDTEDFKRRILVE